MKIGELAMLPVHKFPTNVEPKSSIGGNAPDRAPATLPFDKILGAYRGEIMEGGNGARNICPVDGYLRYFGGPVPD
jgi:hypothetical protein